MVGRPWTSWYGSSVAKRSSNSSRISWCDSRCPALMAPLQANVMASRSYWFRAARVSSLPSASSASISRRHRSASNHGCGFGAACTITVRPPKGSASNPACSRSARVSSTTAYSAGESRSVMGNSSRWLGRPPASKSRISSSNRIRSWAECWSMIRSPLRVSATMYVSWTCQSACRRSSSTPAASAPSVAAGAGPSVGPALTKNAS